MAKHIIMLLLCIMFYIFGDKGVVAPNPEEDPLWDCKDGQCKLRVVKQGELNDFKIANERLLAMKGMQKQTKQDNTQSSSLNALEKENERFKMEHDGLDAAQVHTQAVQDIPRIRKPADFSNNGRVIGTTGKEESILRNKKQFLKVVDCYRQFFRSGLLTTSDDTKADYDFQDILKEFYNEEGYTFDENVEISSEAFPFKGTGFFRKFTIRFAENFSRNGDDDEFKKKLKEYKEKDDETKNSFGELPELFATHYNPNASSDVYYFRSQPLFCTAYSEKETFVADIKKKYST